MQQLTVENPRGSGSKSASAFERVHASARVKLPSRVHVALLYVPPHPTATPDGFPTIPITSCAARSARLNHRISIDHHAPIDHKTDSVQFDYAFRPRFFDRPTFSSATIHHRLNSRQSWIPPTFCYVNARFTTRKIS